MEDTSLKKRYLYKILTNLVGAFVGFISQAIIPRGLGPKSYGDFNFLTSFFGQIVSFLDMGSSSAFYTKISKRPKDLGLISFYSLYSGLIFIIIIISITILSKTAFSSKLWPEQKLLFIYMAAIYAMLNWIVITINNMADAYGITVKVEKIKITQRIFGVIILFLLYYYKQFSLLNFFFYHYIVFIFLGLSFILIIQKYFNVISLKLKLKEFQNYFLEFYNYCSPLFIYSLFGLFVGLFDRWLLQIFGGSIQQGFYGLAYQIGAFCFLFTGAMTPLLTREFSIAHQENDKTKMAFLFRRYIPVLYSLAAYFSCFVAVHYQDVIRIIGGNRFKEASTVVIIMAFYPIHQTYGQLSGSLFYATGNTKLYRNIGIITMLLGLPLTFFLIAPKEYLGLSAGAKGLALKVVLLQFIGVNIQLYFNTRYLNLSFIKYLFHQIIIIIIFISLAILSYVISSKIMLISNNFLLKFLLSGMIYSGFVILLFRFKPYIFGVTNQDLSRIIKLILEKPII